MYPSFLLGNQRPLIQASPINRLTYSLKRASRRCWPRWRSSKKYLTACSMRSSRLGYLPLASSCSTRLFKSGGNVTSTDASDLILCL
jgi:hypothetical protein